MNTLVFMYWTAGIIFVLLLVSLAYVIYFFLKLKHAYNKDMAVMIDKSNRYEIIEIHKSVRPKKSMDYNGGKYYFKAESGLLNKTGKVLYIYSQGKPNPMEIKHNSSEWLDSTSIRGAINNDIVKQLVTPSDPMKDGIQMLANMSCIAGALISLFIALKVFQVIT